MINDIGSIKDSDSRTLLKMWKATVPPGKRPLFRHSHIMFEITYVVTGSGAYTVGNAVHNITSGEIFVFSSNEQHCITAVGENGLEIINLHFEPRYLWGRRYDSLTDRNFNFCFSHSPDFSNCISAENAGEISELFGKIKSELSNKEPEYALFVKSYLNSIVIKLIRDFGYSADTAELSRDRLKSVRRTIQYIDTHLSEHFTLSSLSEIAGMSPNYYSSLFHSVSGITLWDYINSRRIESAIRLLSEEKGRTVLDIATMCGYNNTANFNKAFKKITGLTPSEYRLSGESIY